MPKLLTVRSKRTTGFSLWLVVLLCCSVGLRAETLYQVRKNDTLTGLARKYGVTARQLAAHNGLSSTAKLQIGQKLRIPETASSSERLVTVRRGDTLTGIAKKYGVSVTALARQNGLRADAWLRVGQRLRIPAGGLAPTNPTAELSASVLNAIRSTRVKSGRWKHIVLHHSGTSNGSVQGMDRYHREVRHMENGLAYHFVIGNGKGMRDGEVAVGGRWTRQLQGGHLASESLNRVALGICLVGNFDKGPPTAKQMQSLETLVSALLERCRLPRSAVKTHQQINPVYTRCPGRQFAGSSALKRIQGK